MPNDKYETCNLLIKRLSKLAAGKFEVLFVTRISFFCILDLRSLILHKLEICPFLEKMWVNKQKMQIAVAIIKSHWYAGNKFQCKRVNHPCLIYLKYGHHNCHNGHFLYKQGEKKYANLKAVSVQQAVFHIILSKHIKLFKLKTFMQNKSQNSW